MNKTRIIGVMLLVCCLVVVGCGKKADEKKSVEDVKKEVESMSVDDLKENAQKYKKAIEEKLGDLKSLEAELKEVSPTELLGEKGKELKAKIEPIKESLKKLKDQLKVYVDKLKEKEEDVSDFKV